MYNAYYSAILVYGVQLILLIIVYYLIFSDGGIVPPGSILVLCTRFICAYLMHILVWKDEKLGLNNMRYAAKHPEKF